MCRPRMSSPFDMRVLDEDEHLTYDRLMGMLNESGHHRVNRVFAELVRLRLEFNTLQEHSNDQDLELNAGAERWLDWRGLVLNLQEQVNYLLAKVNGGKVNG